MSLDTHDLDRLAERLIERLAERERILALASKLAKELARRNVIGRGLSQSLAGPGDILQVEDCPKAAHVTYQAGCETGAGKIHSCGVPDFNCAGDEIYDCDVYECKGYYSCGEQLYDHICGDEFNCEDFYCNGAHVFLCSDDYNCMTDFTCRSCTNVKKCEGDYNRTDPGEEGGRDKKAGDFLCGWVGGDEDGFICQDSFSCETADQFECADTALFNCGDGDAGDSFNCISVSDTRFECEGTFGCSPASAYGSA